MLEFGAKALGFNQLDKVLYTRVPLHTGVKMVTNSSWEVNL